MKQFTFTKENIESIFNAGIRIGMESEASYQCGSRTMTNPKVILVDTIYYIVNEGKNFIDNPDYISYDTVESWFKGYR